MTQIYTDSNHGNRLATWNYVRVLHDPDGNMIEGPRPTGTWGKPMGSGRGLQEKSKTQ